MGRLEHWSARAETYVLSWNRHDAPERMARVTIYRVVRVVPPGKRPVEMKRPVLQSVTMQYDAWAELATVLRESGCSVEETERGS